MDTLTRTEETLLRFYVGCQDGTIGDNAPWPLRKQHTARAANGLVRKGYVIEAPGQPRVITDKARRALVALEGNR